MRCNWWWRRCVIPVPGRRPSRALRAHSLLHRPASGPENEFQKVDAGSGRDGDLAADSVANASADPHVGQIEVVLPGGAIVGNLPAANDLRAIVAEGPRVALREVQWREVRRLS